MYCLPCKVAHESAQDKDKGAQDGDDGCAECDQCNSCTVFAPCYAEDFKNVDCSSEEAQQCKKDDCTSCIPCLSDKGSAECKEGQCDKCVESCLNEYAPCMVKEVLSGDEGGDLCKSDVGKDCATGKCSGCWKGADESDQDCLDSCTHCLPYIGCDEQKAFLHHHRRHHVRRHKQ